ncbi:MAG: hypothetical protein K6G26_06520 [Lachnospiraceae bacterium]|nr:hypothetical protein [Lachnospiraceae bacterium]
MFKKIFKFNLLTILTFFICSLIWKSSALIMGYFGPDLTSAEFVCLGLCRIITFCIAFYYLLVIIKGCIKIMLYSKYVDKAELEEDFLSQDIKEYLKEKVIFLRRYFASMNVGVNVCRYSDIAWIYISGNSKNKLGLDNPDEVKKIFLIVKLSSGKKFYTCPVSEKKLDEYNEIVEEIVKKNPNVMVGFTNDNMNRYKEIINKK